MTQRSMLDFKNCEIVVNIFLSQLIPDPESNRCKVVIGSCELEKPYKVYVVALPEGMYLMFYVKYLYASPCLLPF